MLLLEIDWPVVIVDYLVKLPVTIVILLAIAYFIFEKIIKPRMEIKNTQLKTKIEKEIEVETSNKEIEKYNEEAEWKKQVTEAQNKIALATERQNENIDNLVKAIQQLVNKDANNLSLAALEEVLTNLFTCSMYKLVEVCMYVIVNNNIQNEARKKSIISSLSNTNSIEFDYARRFLSKIYYKNKSLDTYMVSINDEHKSKFMYDLIDIIFNSYDNKQNMIQDMINYIKNHFKQHISDALLFVSKF